MNKVEDNSKINININLNLEKKPVPTVVGRRLDNRTTITVNPIKRLLKRKKSEEASTDLQADFSNISYQQTEPTKERLKKLLQAPVRASATPQTHNHSLNQTVIKAEPAPKPAKKSKKKKRSKSKTKTKAKVKAHPPQQVAKVQEIIERNLKQKKQEESKDKSIQILIEKEREVRRRELELKNQEIRMQNAHRFHKSQNKHNNLQIPWGLNQERLKNYLLQQVLQHNNSMIQQQMRQYKQGPDPQKRRDEIGLSFLNNLGEEAVRTMKHQLIEEKQRELSQEHEVSHVHPQVENKEEVRQYQEFKRRLIEMQAEQRRRQQVMKSMRIKENLRNLDNYIKGGSKRSVDRSRSQSEYTVQQPKKRNSSSKKKRKDRRKRELVMQFRNLTERYNQIQENQQASMIGLMSDGSSNIGSNEGVPSQRLEELDTSFFSDRQYMATNQDVSVPTLGHQDEQIRQHILQEDESVDEILNGTQSAQIIHELDEDEQREMAEIRSIEQQAHRRMKTRSLEHDAAILIQRIWRGYKTRQILSYIMAEPEQFDLRNLTESQIEELVNLGYLQVSEQSSQSQKLQRNEVDKREPSKEAKGTQVIFDSEAYNNYIEDSGWQEEEAEPPVPVVQPQTKPEKEDLQRMLDEQRERWQEMLNYVNRLQQTSSKVDLQEVLSNIQKISECVTKPKKKRQLSIDVDKIEEEYFGQQEDAQELAVSPSHQDIDLSEMRLVLGSESMVKDHSKSSEQQLNDSSIFELNPFKDFTSRKFRELLKRENMDQLIKLREQTLEERRRSQGKLIKEMLQEKRISPKTCSHELLKLEKWVTKERKELQERKIEMERGWKGTYDTVLKTQRDLMFMQKNQQDSTVFTILANSFSHEHIPNKFSLSNKDSDIHIKIIDNYHSDTYTQQLSQSYNGSDRAVSVGFTPMKEDSRCVDIALQNHMLQRKYHKYVHDEEKEEVDLCKSEVLEEVQQPAQTLMGPHTSPTPSPKYHERIETPDDLKDWEEDILQELNDMRKEPEPDITRMGQSQMIKISALVDNTEHQKYPSPKNARAFFEQSQPLQTQFDTLESVEVEEELNEKQASSYAIVISNMLIAQELQTLYSEMLEHNIDLLDVVNRHQVVRRSSSDKRVPKQQRGIKTNLQQVKAYLARLNEFIQSIDPQNIVADYVDELVRQVNVPLGPSSKEMLKYLHFNEFNSQSSQFESSTDSAYQHSAILNTELFADMEKHLMESSFIKQSHEFLLELEHIHNKVVFDALNEALDQFRPYGLKGQPFPWRVDSTKLVPRRTTRKEVQHIVAKSEERVVEWAQSLVGIIIDKEDSPFPKMLMFDLEYLNQIKEDRLLRMLQGEILEQEERWINYDEEQTEIEVEMSDIVFDHLICEFIAEVLTPH